MKQASIICSHVLALAAALSIILWSAMPLLCLVHCSGEEGNDCCCVSDDCAPNNGDGWHTPETESHCPCSALCTIQVCIPDNMPVLSGQTPSYGEFPADHSEIPSGHFRALFDPPRAFC